MHHHRRSGDLFSTADHFYFIASISELNTSKTQAADAAWLCAATWTERLPPEKRGPA